MENIKGRFDDAHNAIVARLQAAHLATLPSGKALPLGDYKDPARAVRRCAAPPFFLFAYSCCILLGLGSRTLYPCLLLPLDDYKDRTHAVRRPVFLAAVGFLLGPGHDSGHALRIRTSSSWSLCC